MKNLKNAIKFVKEKRYEVYDKILKTYKVVAQEENIDELIKYVESLFRSHLKAKINIETQNLTSDEFQRQTDIKDNSLVLMDKTLSRRFSAENTSQIMSLYGTLAEREVELYKLNSVGRVAKHKIVKKVCEEIKEEEKSA